MEPPARPVLRGAAHMPPAGLSPHTPPHGTPPDGHTDRACEQLVHTAPRRATGALAQARASLALSRIEHGPKQHHTASLLPSLMPDTATDINKSSEQHSVAAMVAGDAGIAPVASPHELDRLDAVQQGRVVTARMPTAEVTATSPLLARDEPGPDSRPDIALLSAIMQVTPDIGPDAEPGGAICASEGTSAFSDRRILLPRPEAQPVTAARLADHGDLDAVTRSQMDPPQMPLVTYQAPSHSLSAPQSTPPSSHHFHEPGQGLAKSVHAQGPDAIHAKKLDITTHQAPRVSDLATLTVSRGHHLEVPAPICRADSFAASDVGSQGRVRRKEDTDLVLSRLLHDTTVPALIGEARCTLAPEPSPWAVVYSAQGDVRPWTLLFSRQARRQPWTITLQRSPHHTYTVQLDKLLPGSAHFTCYPNFRQYRFCIPSAVPPLLLDVDISGHAPAPWCRLYDARAWIRVFDLRVLQRSLAEAPPTRRASVRSVRSMASERPSRRGSVHSLTVPAEDHMHPSTASESPRHPHPVSQPSHRGSGSHGANVGQPSGLHCAHVGQPSGLHCTHVGQPHDLVRHADLSPIQEGSIDTMRPSPILARDIGGTVTGAHGAASVRQDISPDNYSTRELSSRAGSLEAIPSSGTRTLHVIASSHAMVISEV